MAGQLTIDTLRASTGVLATQNGMSGICRAFVNFNGSTGAIRGTAFNVSSVTRVTTGQYTVNFTTALPDANYSPVFSLSYAAFVGINSTAPTTTALNYWTANSAAIAFDPTYNAVAVFSV